VPRAEVAKVTIDQGARKDVLAREPAPPAPPAMPGEPPPPPPAPTWSVTIDGAAPKLAAGEALDADAVQRMVDHATMIPVAEPADPQRAATAPTAVITIERTATGAASPAPVVLDVVADGERYWVHERGASRAALVDKVAIDDVVGAARATLVKKPGAPAPAPAPSPDDLGLPPGLPDGMMLPPGP
jgi:hypothetical protein